ncbi:MAG: hypothetical protein ACN4G0_20115, partial [Polyangiales bacterium]
IASAGTFLVQSWDQVGDVTRYLTLLAMTALLPALAYLCGIRMKESKSARVLMLTLLALIPIHAGVLGGFVLSQFGQSASTLAPVAQWVAPSRSAALLLVAGSAAVLTPLIWAAFRVLSRPNAKLLTAASVAAHGLLLVPSRSALAASLTVVPILCATVWCAARMKPQTREARFALASLAAPAAVIAARQVLFYDVSSAFWGTVLGVGALGLFYLGKQTEDATVERFAIVPTVLSTAAFTDAAMHWWMASPSSDVWLSYALVTAIPLLAFAWLSARSASFYVRATVLLTAFITVMTLLVDPRPWAALQAIALGIGALSYGFVAGKRFWLYSGIAVAGLGFVVEVAHAIEVFQPSGWLALAGFGAALVGVTAWLERRARSVRDAGGAAKLSRPASAELSQ